MTPSTEEYVKQAEQRMLAAIARNRTKAAEAARLAAARKPRVVTEGGDIVGAAVVEPSRGDPNYRHGSDFVIVRDDLALIQRAEREAWEAQRRQIDPYNIGLYGPASCHRD